MADHSIQLALKQFEFVPGDTIDVRLEVGTGGDKRLQAIRLELGYKNTYYYESRDSDGDRNTTRSSDDVVVALKEMPADHPALAGGSGTFETTLTVPERAPGSVPNWVDWHVKAVLDRKLRRDHRQELPITLHVTAADYEDRAQSAQEVGDKCDMRLDVSSRVARPGDTLSGTLFVEPRSQFDARSVRVDLECRMHHEDDIVRELGDDVEVTLGQNVSFAPGVPQEFGFSITVPPAAAPTLHAKHNLVRWLLKGICDRPMRGDYTVAAELVVFNAPA
jgi:hypothetical protein